jgi:hypothetical protein
MWMIFPTLSHPTERSPYFGVGVRNGRTRTDVKKDVPQDYVQAHIWFNLAASLRPTGEFGVRHRDSAADQLTSDALNEAQRRARDWDAAHPREP